MFAMNHLQEVWYVTCWLARVGQEVTHNEVACLRTHLVCIEVVRFVGALLGVEQQLHDHSQHIAPREAVL
jgi:hypothetical protein